MFSGLVEGIGTLVARASLASGERFVISHGLGELGLGASIAVSGACLTVTAEEKDGERSRFSVELSVETLARTQLGKLELGDPVNLERSLTLATRLGGHLVTGHVDAVAEIAAVDPLGDMTRVTVALPPAIAPYVAEKGSLTVDGVSLTVNEVTRETASLLLIPHTRSVTTLGRLTPGRNVNLEVDLVARYVARLLSFREVPPLPELTASST
jgi:riboflavin synthase